MRRIDKEEFEEKLKNRKPDERLKFVNLEFDNIDFSGCDLSNMVFDLCMFIDCKFENVNFEGSSINDAQLDDCPLKGSNFENASLCRTTMRRCDMTGCNIKGTDFHSAVLEYAILDGVIQDENTKWFRLYCPETGPFLAYKKCVNDRLVQLLVPADAKRTSATNSACRVSKAKVLTIKSFDYTQEFHEAWSLAAENFVYPKGEWLEIPDFNEDRWFESTTGIHVWMTREEAMAY